MYKHEDLSLVPRHGGTHFKPKSEEAEAQGSLRAHGPDSLACLVSFRPVRDHFKKYKVGEMVQR